MANPDIDFNPDPTGGTRGQQAIEAMGLNNPQTNNQLNPFADILPKSATFYWKMTNPAKSPTLVQSGGEIGKAAGYGPAPKLSPATSSHNGNEHTQTNTGPSTHINIRDTHHWTESPAQSRREVPMLMLKEMRILSNPMLNQVMNNIGIAVQTTAGTAEGLSDAMKAFAALKVDDGKLAPGTSSDLLRELQSASAEAIESVGKRRDTYYSDPLNPYHMLYTTTPTKFRYTFPYLENGYISKTGQFGDQPKSGFLTDLTSIAANAATDISLKRLTAPGRMIEEPKGFNFTGREKSYTVTFPLFNTKDYASVMKNWQFVYLLTYQNTPNRITRDLVDPPCIYEAKIPGVWYSKYASITNMTIDFMGARREMDMPVMYLDSANDSVSDNKSESMWLPQKRKITTIIPDAYMVKITVTELFSETQNFLYHMVKESMNDRVRVTSSTTGPG